ncbi:ATP-binding cassette domain-containing protein [Martelella mediterranea]|uniref:Thiamine import ATP-binding protein ThiQ n=1 Tax=Martelella mediterranea DSM 17316 TaxID=1122214 RepID=A0A1U9YXW9_9HYPH|nr:ATP-binding cassette domain-containing protein [Martelella mediterranea]AQZ50274.1 Thiamine import ATP-binding protein ThiQ [Martelella mediterranea DSM 17316]
MPVDITLDDVALRLGDKDFLFDGQIEGAKVSAVTGRSGSGKTTLLNLIAGFEKPDSGEILIAGERMNGLHISRRPVTVVFQENNLFAHLDIFTNVGLGLDPALKLDEAGREKVRDALKRVGLEGYDKRKPATLSGGERQRAAFARALVRDRPVLLLDEPFAALDPDMRGEMGRLLLELHRESGNTVVIVSHEPDEVEAIADHRLVVEDGQLSARY